MSALLWAVIGVTIGAAVLHGALGLGRLPDRTYLSFAGIMAMLAAFVFFEWKLYSATTSGAAVEVLRRQVIAGHVMLAFVLVFIPAYTEVRIPRWLNAAYWVGLAGLFVANLALPHGVWFSARPLVLPSTFRGEPYTGVVAPQLTLIQYLHTLYVLSVFVLSFTCALVLVRRGERQRGALLAIALVVATVQHGVDVVRDAIGGSWPYVAEFGLVTWGLMMSAQLAIDYRVSQQRLRATLSTAEGHAAELARIVDATLHVRDTLNTPLQTLELDLATRAAREPAEESTLAELRSAVRELDQLSRSVEHLSDHHRSPPTSEERPT